MSKNRYSSKVSIRFLKFYFIVLFLLAIPKLYAQLEISTDRATAVYTLGELMNFNVSSNSSGTVEYTIRYDGFSPIIAQGEIQLTPEKTAKIPFTLDHPGFVVIRAKRGGHTRYAGAAFSPYDIAPFEEEPEDFDEFWETQKQALDEIDMNPKVLFDYETEYTKNYTLRLDHIDNRRIHGLLSVPKGDGPFPGMLILPAFGGETTVNNPETLAERVGAITVSINIHNAEVGDDDPNAYFPDNYEDKAGNYYRYAILGALRSLDYISSRDDFDGENLGVTGVSQGGGLSFMTAGLDNRVNLLVQNNAALCEHAGLKYGRATGFPNYLFKSRSTIATIEHETATIEATKYYDAVHFAKRYNGPSLSFVGYIDDICPPATDFAAYNQLRGHKIMMHSVDKGHDNPEEYWTTTRFEFFRRFVPAMRTPPFPWVDSSLGYFANAGEDSNTSTGSSLTINGTVEFNEEINNSWEVLWEKVDGPGKVIFDNATARNTTVSFTEPGIYTLRFNAFDKDNLATTQKYFTISDHIQITVSN